MSQVVQHLPRESRNRIWNVKVRIFYFLHHSFYSSVRELPMSFQADVSPVLLDENGEVLTEEIIAIRVQDLLDELYDGEADDAMRRDARAVVLQMAEMGRLVAMKYQPTELSTDPERCASHV